MVGVICNVGVGNLEVVGMKNQFGCGGKLDIIQLRGHVDKYGINLIDLKGFV